MVKTCVQSLLLWAIQRSQNPRCPPKASPPSTRIEPSIAQARRHPHAGRGRGHDHTPSARSPPFLACSLAPPGQSRAPGSRGRSQRGGHTRLGGWGSGLAPLLGVGGVRPDADWLHVRRLLPGLPGAGEPSEKTVHLLAKCLTTL